MSDDTIEEKAKAIEVMWERLIKEGYIAQRWNEDFNRAYEFEYNMKHNCPVCAGASTCCTDIGWIDELLPIENGMRFLTREQGEALDERRNAGDYGKEIVSLIIRCNECNYTVCIPELEGDPEEIEGAVHAWSLLSGMHFIDAVYVPENDEHGFQETIANAADILCAFEEGDKVDAHELGKATTAICRLRDAIADEVCVQHDGIVLFFEDW